MELLQDTDGFLTAEELAEEEKELQRMFEKDNFVPADKDPFEPESGFQGGETMIEDFEKEQIVAKCVGCDRVVGDFCKTYNYPASWFRNGKHCPLASHIKSEPFAPVGKTRVGQQKQRKGH